MTEESRERVAVLSAGEGGAADGFAALARACARSLNAPCVEVYLAGEGGYRGVAAADGAAGARRLRAWAEASATGEICLGRTAEVRDGAGGDATPGVAAVVAMPLRGTDGEVLGALCAADVQPREWSRAEIELLHDFTAAAAAKAALARELVRQKQAEQQLVRSALYDPLTGLPNRLLFMERLGHAIARARRHEEAQFAVVFLDLDRFKVVNDSLGHHVGDELLVAIAARLKLCLRAADTVARLGGDEFAVLLETIREVADATRVAERIRRELEAPVNLSGYEVFTTASIGIALSSTAYDRPEYLLRNADMAMYRAKASGHGRYEVFDRAMHAEALARLQLETDLRRALERDEFDLAYQPIIELGTGTICGFETLLRWHHPAQGNIPPADFIPVAEETGLIVPIGAWVLRQACARLREWQDRFGGDVPLSIAVNLSVKQFSQPDLVDQVRRLLGEVALEPANLRLEITESVIVQNSEAATRVLHELKALGVQIFMDDFGTGYSSLSYLHRLPLDALKIDRSFIGGMEADRRSYQLVRTILTLARTVGVRVVAEGIETAAQLRELRSLGCEFGQGFFFSRPLDPQAAEALLASRPSW